MVTVDDVAKAVGDLLATLPAVTALVPGGFWLDRAAEGATQPYGVFTVELGRAELDSSDEYTVPATVRLAVFADQVAAADVNGIQKQVGLAVRPSAAGLTLRAGYVLHALPAQADARLDARRRNGSDVVACRFAWELLCQGANSSA